VHAAQRAFLVVKGDVRLRDHGVEPVCLELLLTEGPCKEPAIIFSAINFNYKRTFEFRFSENHIVYSSSFTATEYGQRTRALESVAPELIALFVTRLHYFSRSVQPSLSRALVDAKLAHLLVRWWFLSCED
jgi:hypothetical protein